MAIVFARTKNLERTWPFVPEALMARLNELDEVRVVQVERGAALGEATNLSDVSCIALFGGVLTEACLAKAPGLKAIGAVLDNWGHRSCPVDTLFERDIPMIDGTRGWAPSVAEVTLALTLNALRMIPHWHKRMAAGERLWHFEYAQFCDHPEFVNGTLGSKTVGVMDWGKSAGAWQCGAAHSARGCSATTRLFQKRGWTNSAWRAWKWMSWSIHARCDRDIPPTPSCEENSVAGTHLSVAKRRAGRDHHAGACRGYGRLARAHSRQ